MRHKTYIQQQHKKKKKMVEGTLKIEGNTKHYNKNKRKIELKT